MRKRGRAGGSVASIVIGFFLIFIVVSAIYYYVRNLGQFFGGNNGGVGSANLSITTTATSLPTSANTTAASGNVSLAQLQSLTFANASKCDGLLDPKFWDKAIQSSGKTTVTIVPNTVYGLSQSWNGWTEFFRDSISNPPSWITSDGPSMFASSLVNGLAANVMGTHNVTKAAAVMTNYTAYVGGLSATGLDFLSFGGLSALRVYYDTGSFTQAAATTFPGQLYQLFSLSQDCTYSEEQRAQFFGTALSMTALVLATSGKDGFGPKFEGLLGELGLRDAWGAMKSYVKQITDLSPRAAYQAVMVLSTLAKKFPDAKVGDLTTFTSSRIANMVSVLKDKGFSADEIAQKVADLSKAVDESDDAGHAANVADAISYQAEGFMRVNIGPNRVPYLYSSSATPRGITASFLALILPGFKVGEVTALKVTVHKLWYEIQSYHVYGGGKYAAFALPADVVKSGDELGLSFELLPVEEFVSSFGQITLTNPPGVNWVAVAVTLKNFKVIDGALKFDVLQTNPWSGATELTIRGQVVNYPVASTNGGIYAEFAINDFSGRSTNIRIRYDGFSPNGADLQLARGDGSRPVSFVSYDGFRLRIVYDSTNKVATIYLEPPSESIYGLDRMDPYSGAYLKLVQGKYTNAWQIDNVVMQRDLEKAMLNRGSTYDLGRLGSEIAYVVGDKDLGLKNMILEEPSQGGRDLYTQDNRVAIQARFLKNLGTDRETAIQNALFALANKLQQDYKYQQLQIKDGFAILSYLDTDGTIKTIILEVPRW